MVSKTRTLFARAAVATLGALATLGLSSAEAFVIKPLPDALATSSVVTTIAVCTTQGQVFRAPGPPSVCKEHGAVPFVARDRSTDYKPDRRFWTFSHTAPGTGGCAVYIHRVTGKRRQFCGE